jgi:hypothetical protein
MCVGVCGCLFVYFQVSVVELSVTYCVDHFLKIDDFVFFLPNFDVSFLRHVDVLFSKFRFVCQQSLISTIYYIFIYA